MKIHISIPFSIEKNLGRAYNEEMARVPDEDWACLIDHDVQFLTSDAINHLYKYVELFPDTGIFTCFTNRLHPLAANQLLLGRVDHDSSIINHLKQAEIQKKKLYEVTELNKHISGFLMLIKKETWSEVYGFNEDKLCLGVDNIFSDKILVSGKKILRMDGIYVFHQYRLLNGIKDKTHLL
jgi:GT2 family glycosyltransferase